MKYFTHLHVLFSLCFVLCSTSIIAAETPAQSKPEAKPELKVINLPVYPAPIPQPALKYRLLPRAIAQTPGNAALLYDKVFEQFAAWECKNDIPSNDSENAKQLERFYINTEKLDAWLEVPLNELPKDDLRKLFDNMEPWMEYVEMASRRLECDWELPIREMNNPFEIDLQQAMRAKTLGKILALKVRLSLAEGKPEEAIKSLQMGFALSQQIGKEPLVSCLVGLAIANIMREQLLDLCQLKNAPNLYWSLSTLPHPLISIKKGLESEEVVLERLLPELQEARKGQHSPEQWQKIWESVVERINLLFTSDNNYKKEEYDSKKLLNENYPKARDYLINLGWPKKDIQSMAPAQVLLLYCAEIWDETRDDYMKLLSIDYSQWPNNWQDRFNELLKSYKQKEVLPLSDLLPAITVAARAQARVEREIESLRCIEAIRLYAYLHDGKLPDILGDVKEVPIPPTNPLTGKPFSYHLEGDTAVLLADGDMRINYEYHIKIAK